MSLTAAQKATLKADIAADSSLNSQPNNDTGNQNIANAYNTVVVPTFFVFRTSVPIVEINDQITWQKLTPVDVPDGTTNWQNRAVACQGMQLNLQLLLASGGASGLINATKANVRKGLQDSLSTVPSSTGGAAQDAGWGNVKNVLSRGATRVEKLFADTSGAQDGTTVAKSALMTLEGPITKTDVEEARNS